MPALKRWVAALRPQRLVLSTQLPDGEPTEKLREAITRTMIEEFRKNPNTFCWGQDVASKDKGGVFNLTKGMLQEFGPDRIFNGPIAEDFIVGTANGMSRFSKDIRIIIEAAQFADYVWPAMEQVVETTHDYWRSKGQFSPNIVCRLASGGYITGGLYHSQNVEAIMSHLPGVRVIYPAFADDAAGLLRTAVRSEGLTFFLEPKYLYNRPEARAPKTADNFAIPFGQGRVRRSGTDMSIITYGNTVHHSLRVAEKLEATEALWADLSRTPADVPVPQWHRDVLKARMESPATWLDWEQVKASLREMARQEGDAPNDHRDS